VSSSRRLTGCLVLLAGAFAAAPAAASAAAPSYHSPGYAGNTSFRNVTPAPLPAITLGTGKYPALLVDGAGTAHIVFAQDGGSTAADTISFCNLQRGQKSCASSGVAPNPLAPDSSAGQAFLGNFPAGNHDFSGPIPLDIGNELFVVDRRFPDAFKTPDGGMSDSNVFEWSSDNGGATLTGPGEIGNNQAGGGAVAFGDPSAPSIGTISRTQTEGTFFQASQEGQYTTAKAQLGTPAQAYDGELAVDPGAGTSRPVAVFADTSGNVFVREFSGQGSPNDAANWSQASFGGYDPQIVGGPAGVFVLYSDSGVSGGRLLLQRITGGQPSGAAVTLGRAVSDPAISEDVTGRISLAYTDGHGVEVRSSADGVDFSTPELTATIPSGASIGHLVTAATGDGGGFVSFVRDATGAEGIGTIVASAFGSQRQTGAPGFGTLPGGGLGSAIGDQLATSTCQSAKFGEVDAEITAGCYGHDPQNPNLDVTLGEVDLNGLRIIPDPGVRIGIDPRLHTIDTTGPVRVVLSASGIPDITLFHGELHAKLPTAGVGDDLFDLKELSAPIIAGFPIDGDVDVKLAHGGVDIPISLKLPDYFGGVTGSAVLHATTSGGLQLSSLSFTIGDANLGALELKDLSVSYTMQGEVWKGAATLWVPAGGDALRASLAVEFDHGDFKSGSADLGLSYPGIPLDAVDTPPELYLTHAGLGLGLNPFSLSGTVGLGVTPLPPIPPETGGPRDFAFSLDGTLSVSFGSPVTITATATGFLYTVQLGQATLVYKLPDSVSLTGSAKLDLGILSLDGQIGAIIDPQHHLYGGKIQTDVTIHTPSPIPDIKLSGVAVAFNNKGFGVYNPYPPFIGTITYNWGDALPSVVPGANVTSRYTAGIPGAAATARFPGEGLAHAAAAASFTVPSGAPSASIIVHGTGGAPAITLTSPSGQQITPATQFGNGVSTMAIFDTPAQQTNVGILHPAAGRWSVSAAAGSAPISSVDYAIGETPPKLSASVAGSGFARSVRYRARIPANTTVAVQEQTGSLLHVIGTLRNGSGTIRFRPASGPAGVRKLVAQISNNGLPIQNQTLSSFSVPAPPKPGKASHLSVRASGRSFTYSYRPPSGAAHVIVRIVATDGRHLQRLVAPSSRGGSIPVIGFKDGVKVTVLGVRADGVSGPALSASVRRRS
jgi:hypothetical protein